MKGSVIGYGMIIGILVVTSFLGIYITKTGDIKREIVTTEGKIISFVNEAELLIKTFNQSIEFISQRAAYDLGKNGGFNGEIFIWNYFYPRLDVLERNLDKKIENNLPSEDIIGERMVTWGKSEINTNPIGFIENSKSFSIEGNKSLYIYDKPIETKVSWDPFKIKSSVRSSYFRLLYVGRQILENEKYNTTLYDIGNLSNLLERDYRDLDFNITTAIEYPNLIKNPSFEDDFDNWAQRVRGVAQYEKIDNIIHYDGSKSYYLNDSDNTSVTARCQNFTVEPEKIYMATAFANVYEGNIAVWISGGELSPEIYTGECSDDNNIKILQPTGNWEKVILFCKTETKDFINICVGTRYLKTGPENYDGSGWFDNVTVQLAPDLINIFIEDNTCILFYNEYYCIAPLKEGEKGIIISNKTIPYDYLKLNYTINSTQKSYTDLISDFALEAVPPFDSVDSGESTQTSINVRSIGGDVAPVHLSYAVESATTHAPEPTINISFDRNDEKPNFASIMRIETKSWTLSDIYTIRITGTASSIVKTIEFNLTVNPIMQFSLEAIPNNADITQGDTKTVDVNISFINGTAVPVFLSSSSIPSTTITFLDDGNPLDNCVPSCTLKMRVATQPTIPTGNHEIVITGIGGGVKNATKLYLRIHPPFDYEIRLGSYYGEVYQKRYKEETVTIENIVPTSIPQQVSLTSTVTRKGTTTIEPTISVSFIPSNSCIPNLICSITMNISTNESTPIGSYIINVEPNGSPSKSKTYELNVTIPPFDFDISLDLYSRTIEAGQFVTPIATLTTVEGTPENVKLNYSINVNEPTISVSYSPSDTCKPNLTCSINLNISTQPKTPTQAGTPPGDYFITIKGTATGGKIVTTPQSYKLTVTKSSFEFGILLSSYSTTLFRGEHKEEIVTIRTIQGDPEDVILGYSMNSSESTIGVVFKPSNTCKPAPSECTRTMNITTETTTPKGAYRIKVSGSSVSAYAEAGSYDLTVKEFVPFDFSISISPGSGTIQNVNGGTNTSTITVTKLQGTNNEEVSISCSKPSGLTVSCYPSKCTPNPTCTSTLTVSTTRSTPLGTYRITVDGTSISAIHSTSYDLTVKAAIFFKPYDTCKSIVENPLYEPGLVWWSEGRGDSCEGKKSDVVEYDTEPYSDRILGYSFPSIHENNEVSAVSIEGFDYKNFKRNIVTSFIWESIGDESRIAECGTCDYTQHLCSWFWNIYYEIGLKRQDEVWKIPPGNIPQNPGAILNDADESGKPYSNFRSAWCGNSNVNCLLCHNTVEYKSAWYICNTQIDSVPVGSGVVMKNVGDVVGDSYWGCYKCDSSGNWIGTSC